ncbi:MAG: type II secretion system F family protein [Oscillospiraceae bacterium]|nr:type II secretion system F family protein [Oscillospiraceae bacterium]
MPKFKYTAVSSAGENTGGEYTAPDKQSVISMLRQGGYYPIDITYVADDVDRVTKTRIKMKPLAAFCVQMASMLKAGVSVSKTLEILSSQTDNAPLRSIISDVFVKVQRGVSLTAAFSSYRDNFPMLFHSMLEAGEASGTLDMCLERAGSSFTRSAKLNNKLRNAMIYPIVLVCAIIAVVTLMFAFVIPAFTQMYAESGAELPGFTQALINVSEFVVNYWYLIIMFIVVAVVGFRMWLGTEKGRISFDRFKLRVPVLKKLLTKVYAARYSRSLSSLSLAGVALTEGLNITARSISNRYMEKDLYAVAEAVTKGEELSGQLEQMDSLPPMIKYLTRLGEESGTMDSLLNQAADFYDDESESEVQAFMALMEPLLIIAMAAIVVPIVIAIILPVFNMVKMIQYQ